MKSHNNITKLIDQLDTIRGCLATTYYYKQDFIILCVNTRKEDVPGGRVIVGIIISIQDNSIPKISLGSSIVLMPNAIQSIWIPKHKDPRGL